MTTATAALEPVMAGLSATPPHPLPFATEMEVRAFVLHREEGDAVVYSAPGTAALRRPALQLLGHWHEAAFGGPPAGAPVVVHRDDAARLPDPWEAHRLLDRPTPLGEDLWAIPIPGHTPGSTAYLWDSGRLRFLFTADSVVLDGDRWLAAVLDSSDRKAYVASLGRLRDLDFDVLVPWAAGAGQAPVAAVEREEARRRLDEVRERVLRGEDR